MKKKILFVDDEPDILEQAKLFLEREDDRFEVIGSKSVPEALKMLDDNDFDVIISDYQLGNIDGLEFLKEIRVERTRDIPFIMFTGKGREEVAMEALNLGADRYLQKGGDPKSQYAVLAQAIVQESKHYRTEVSLKKKDELLTQIFERSEEGFYIRDLSGKITFVNEAFAQIHGCSRDEIIGKDSRSFLTEDSKEQVEDLEIDDLVDRWKSVEIETKSGRKKTLQNAIFPLRDEDGEIQEIFGIVKDITDSVEAEERLKKNKERLDLALKGTEAGIWDWYVQTGEMVVNERWAEMVGYELEELEPVDIETWEDLAHPDDLGRSYGLMEKHFSGETEFYEFEGRMKHKDGSWVWVLDKGKVVEWDDEGDPVRMTGTHIDITEKKEVEELANEMYSLRSAIRQINQLIVQEDDLSSLLQKTCKMLKDLRTYMDISIAIQREDDRIVPIAHCGDHERKLWGMEGKEDDEIPMCIQEVTESGEVHIIKDVEKECGGCEYCKHEKNHKSILVPMLKDGKVNGVLSACISLDKEITEEEIELLEEVCGDLAFARDKMVAEKKLQENEERYRRLFETAQDGMLILDAETGKIEDANPYLLDILGYSKEELVGKELWDIGTFTEMVESRARFEKLVQEGYIRYEDMPLEKKDGGDVPVEFVSNIYDVGEKKVVQCNIREITQRKLARDSLEHMSKSISRVTGEELFESIVDELIQWFGVDGACIGRIQNDGTTVTSLAMKLDGEWIDDYEYELDGTPCENVAEHGACLYEDGVVEMFPEDEELKGLGIEGYMGVPIRDSYGKNMGVIWAVSRERIMDIPVNWKELLEMIASRAGAEIKRIESEENYKKLIESMNDAVFIHDLQGNILEVNDQAIERLGYSKKELIDMNLVDIDHPGYHKYISDVMEKIEQKGKHLFEYVHITKEGRNIPVEVNSSMTSYGGDRVILSVVRDIKDRVEREKELRAMYKILRLSKERDIDITDLLIKIVNEIPEAFQRPEITTCRIELDGVDHHDDGFEETKWSLKKDIIVDGEKRGDIEVYYLEERPEEDIGPFLKEEEELIEGVAEVISIEINRKEGEKEIKFRSNLLEHVDSAVMYTDKDGTIKYWNEKAEEIYGWEADEVMGKNIVEVTPSMMNKDLAENIMKDLKKGKRWEGEFTVKRKDGSLFDAWVVDSPVHDEEGEIVGVVGISYDISERKTLERRLKESHEEIKALYELSSKLQNCKTEEEVYELAISVVDKILNFDVSGIVVEERGKAVVKANTEDTPEELKETTDIDEGVVGLVFKEKKPYLIDDIRGFCKARPKSKKYLSGITVPLGDIGVFQAISKEVGGFDKFDLEIAQLFITHVKEALDRVDRRDKEQFLNTLMRHDVSNKLQIIRGYLQLLEEEDKFTSKGKDYLHNALNSVSLVDDLVEKIDLLIKASDEKVDRVDITTNINQAVHHIKHQARGKGMVLKVNCPDKISSVKGGPLLSEVFSNVIENSIKHSNGSLIAIDCEEHKDEIICHIKDDGDGIPDEIKDKIFEKEYKQGKNQGSGLGLYLVKLIVESYHGRVSVKDSDIGGAQFDIFLKKA